MMDVLWLDESIEGREHWITSRSFHKVLLYTFSLWLWTAIACLFFGWCKKPILYLADPSTKRMGEKKSHSGVCVCVYRYIYNACPSFLQMVMIRRVEHFLLGPGAPWPVVLVHWRSAALQFKWFFVISIRWKRRQQAKKKEKRETDGVDEREDVPPFSFYSLPCLRWPAVSQNR